MKTELGPDATSLGWGFQHALLDHGGKHSSDELRSMQDWFLRYAVQRGPGVAEVACQITVRPDALAASKLPLEAVVQAARKGNNDVGRTPGRALGPRVHGAWSRLREGWMDLLVYPAIYCLWRRRGLSEGAPTEP